MNEVRTAIKSLMPDEWWNKLQASCVGVAGCGGLGSNVALALARSGVGELIVADQDVVEPSNLNRQSYWPEHVGKPKVVVLKELIEKLGLEVSVQAVQIRINKENIFEVFEKPSILVEAFDRVDSKQVMMESVSDFRFAQKFLVSASGLAGIESCNRIVTKQVGERIVLCGDGGADADAKNPPMAPRVLTAAAHQANAVLRLILGLKE